MTELQFGRWKDFATRMARTYYRASRRPTGKWIAEVVDDFFDCFDDAEIPCIVSWDDSTAYPDGNPYFGRENHLSWCGCDGRRYVSGEPDPQCRECGGSGLRHAPYRPHCIGDTVSEFLDGYEAFGQVECRACQDDNEDPLSVPPESAFVVCEGEGNAKAHVRQCYKFARALCGCAVGVDAGGDAMVRRVVAAYTKNIPGSRKNICWRCAKLLHDAMAKAATIQPICQCDELSDLAEEEWDEQFGAPVRCCIRAGLDMASAPSAGVVGFDAGDIRRMYPEGVPDWVFPPGERLHYWLSDEENGTFADLPDRAGLVL